MPFIQRTDPGHCSVWTVRPTQRQGSTRSPLPLTFLEITPPFWKLQGQGVGTHSLGLPTVAIPGAPAMVGEGSAPSLVSTSALWAMKTQLSDQWSFEPEAFLARRARLPSSSPLPSLGGPSETLPARAEVESRGSKAPGSSMKASWAPITYLLPTISPEAEARGLCPDHHLPQRDPLVPLPPRAGGLSGQEKEGGTERR